jgi:hypothetical protein
MGHFKEHSKREGDIILESDTKNFLSDLIYIIQDKYNQTIDDSKENSDKKFYQGLNFAYYDVLDVIESQMESFGYNVKEFRSITPMLWEKIER